MAGIIETHIESEETPKQRQGRRFSPIDDKYNPFRRQWSSKDRHSFIGLSQNNLRVHYKGSGKNSKDTASVRANHSVPPNSGVYYYEVKIVSKGRDGYIGIGMSAGGVNLNKLPGWEKSSYGYHADDGCVFNSSGTGQQFGPVFTTGDVIGCGFNLVDRSIFFTKNGIKLGNAVTDVPANLKLYPSVGLQTPGEIVEANFGDSPFVFDLEAVLVEVKHQVHNSISSVPLVKGAGVWQLELHKILLGYLVHHGYTNTAVQFARSTGLELEESVESMKNRQRIQALMLKGRTSQAIAIVNRLYPTLLDDNKELMFRILCRQFIEIVSGCDKMECVNTNEDSSESPVAMDTDEVNTEETKGSGDKSLQVINFDSDSSSVEKLLTFGRHLQTLFTEITRDKPNNSLQTLLQDSFSLLAYENPYNSPVSYLLQPSQREADTADLNSAILKANGLPGQPELEFALGHSTECLKLMSENGLGSAAFASVTDILKAPIHHTCSLTV